MTFTRVFLDARGIEWEVYDDSVISVALALDWDYHPQRKDPGLVFTSKADRRRLWPAPSGWETMTNEQLSDLCEHAASVK